MFRLPTYYKNDTKDYKDVAIALFHNEGIKAIGWNGYIALEAMKNDERYYHSKDRVKAYWYSNKPTKNYAAVFHTDSLKGDE